MYIFLCDDALNWTSLKFLKRLIVGTLSLLHLDDQVDHRSLFTQSRCGWITRAIGSPERRRGLYPAENFGRS